ncbi:MAG TPA: AgmX/PglI C-terminal domain-containing protein, partial [Oligoflexia bacterium]|nr:AgmX/PglI C-terminal domain-containing protein [Oligoflexia bacterium]
PFFGSGKSGRYELVDFDGAEGCRLNLHPSMTGVVSRDGQVMAVNSESSAPVTLREKDFAKIKIKDMSFFLSFSPAPPRLKSARLGRRDPLFVRMLMLSIASTVAIIATIAGVTVDPTIEIEQLPERVATIIYEPKFLPIERPPLPVAKTEPAPSVAPAPKPPKVKIDVAEVKKPEEPAPKNAMIGVKPEQSKPVPKPPAPPKEASPKKQVVSGKAGGQEGAGAKAKGEEGGRGKPNAKPNPVAQTKIARPGDAKKNSGLSASPGQSQTNSMGVVDVFKSNAGTLSKIFAGGKGASTAADKLEGYSGFTTRGEGGLGAAGTGAGGGGSSMGLGGLADKGPGGGKQGKGLGALGSGGNILGGKGTLAIDTGGSAEPIVLGAIDTSAIAREIDKHRDEIKYCYEKEINADRPDLSGRVVMRFEIGASGSVSSAGVAATTLRHAATEQCIVDVIKRIQFPPVAGGGETDVTFPFVFKPTNK